MAEEDVSREGCGDDDKGARVMDLQTGNTQAKYALWSGIGTWAINGMGCCLSMIPVVGLVLTVPLSLVALVLAVAAVVFGMQGRKQATASGVGGGEATVGLALGASCLVLTVLGLVLVVVLGGVAAVGAMVGG